MKLDEFEQGEDLVRKCMEIALICLSSSFACWSPELPSLLLKSLCSQKEFLLREIDDFVKNILKSA